MLRLISVLVRRVDDVAFVRCGNTMNRCVGNKCMRSVTITLFISAKGEGIEEGVDICIG